MLEKALVVLENILIEMNELLAVIKNKENNKDMSSLVKIGKKYSNLLNGDESKIFLLYQLLNSMFHEDKNIVSKNYYIFYSKKLLQQYSLSDFVLEKVNKKYTETADHEFGAIESFYEEYRPIPGNSVLLIDDLCQCKNSKQVKFILSKIFDSYCFDLDYIAFYRYKVSIVDEEFIADIKYQEESNYYLEKWYSLMTTLDDWIAFPNTHFLKYLEIFADKKTTALALDIQRSLYKEALDIELYSLKSNIKELNVDSQKQVISIQQELISRFLSGSYSVLDFKRLSNIVQFDRPEEVILAYDDIMRFETYDFSTYLPYDGHYKRKSPRFAAELLINYKKFLDNQLILISSDKKLPIISLDKADNKSSSKPIRKDFGFKSRSKLSSLETVIKELTTEFDFIDLNNCSLKDVIIVLTTNDYTQEKNKIHSGCKTLLFTYILKRLKPYFYNFNSISITNSALFFPKNSSKPFKLSNYNKSYNPTKEELAKLNRILNFLDSN